MRTKWFKSGVSLTAVILLLCVSRPQATAQSRDSLLNVYNTQTIHSFGRIYVKGSKRLTFRELGNEFEPGGTKDLYLKSKKSLVLGQVLTVASIAALVGSAVLRKNEEKGGIALLVVGIGLNLGNLSLRKKSTELVDRALWQRNKEILFNVR